MSISSWLRNRNPKRPLPTRFRPQLEVLDGRLVPSTLHVTNLSGDAYLKGSLPYEVAHASSSGKDTIDFNVRGQINLYTELNISHGVTIKGPGANRLTLTTDYNFGDPWGSYFPRALEVNADKPVAISGITITDNDVRDIAGSSMGSAVYNHSTLTMSDCVLTDNEADYGGAIYNAGTMSLTNCILKNNGAYYGGAIYNTGTLTVTGSTLSFNYAYAFGSPGGTIDNAGTAYVGTTTFVLSDVVGPYTDLGGNTFITQQPQIGSFTAGAGTVAAGDSLTLTATNISDANPNSSITQVLIYGPNSIGGIPLGYATRTSPGVWTLKLSTAGWAPGTDTFYAVAVDSYCMSSVAAAVAVEVT